jgi:hypothetical protein
LTDLITEVQSYNVAPIYDAYGFNLQDPPLYTSILPMNLPMGFSTMGSLIESPYLALSSYVLVVSTIYSSGCNTTFPITSYGYNSFSYYQISTGRSTIAFNQDLSRGTNYSIANNFSASNAFRYNFTSVIPDSSYEFDILFARQKSDEIMVFYPIKKINLAYSYKDIMYVSSQLIANNISFNSANISSLVSYTANISSLKISSINSLKTSDFTLNSTFATYLNNVNSTINTGLSSYVTPTITSTLASYVNTVNSTINTNLSSFSNNSTSLTSTLASYLNTVNSTINTNLSTFSSVNIYPDIQSASTISTIYTNISNLASTFAGGVSSFSITPPQQTYISTMYTSSIFYGGFRQPFIQVGYANMAVGIPIVLPVAYKDGNYSIQLTYSNLTQPVNALFASNVNSNQFYVTGDIGTTFYWTTYGDIF